MLNERTGNRRLSRRNLEVLKYAINSLVFTLKLYRIKLDFI
jgi:hypothetical protein